MAWKKNDLPKDGKKLVTIVGEWEKANASYQTY